MTGPSRLLGRSTRLLCTTALTTVTCDTNAPNPDTNRIDGRNSDNVTVTGNVTFEATLAYEAEIDTASNLDRIDVSGSASPDGTISLFGVNVPKGFHASPICTNLSADTLTASIKAGRLFGNALTKRGPLVNGETRTATALFAGTSALAANSRPRSLGAVNPEPVEASTGPIGVWGAVFRQSASADCASTVS